MGKKVLAPLVSIAGTVIGSMVGMPYLGSALGGAIGGGISGGNLKSAVLGGVTGALGTGLGNVASKGLAGLGGLSGGSGVGSLLGGAGADVLADTVSPVLIEAAKGGAGSLLGGVTAGQLAGSGVGSLLGQALSGGGSRPGGDGVTEVDPVTITPGQPGMNPGDLGGLVPATGFQPGDDIITGGIGEENLYDSEPGSDDQLTGKPGGGLVNDLVGNTIGGVAAGNLTNGLASLLGLGPKVTGTVTGAPGVTPTPVPGVDGSGGGTGSVSPVQPGTPANSTVTPSASGASGAPGGSGLFSAGGKGAAAVSGSVSAPAGLEVQGSMAPDIYPWRRAS